jgi:hypothetical protein
MLEHPTTAPPSEATPAAGPMARANAPGQVTGEQPPIRARAGGAAMASGDPLHRRLQRVVASRAMERGPACEPVAGKLPPGLYEEDVDAVGGRWRDRLRRGSKKPAAPSPATAAPVKAVEAPPKLSYRTEKAKAGTTCGGFSWTVQWLLDKPSPGGGWVVQRVDAARDVKDCNGDVATPATSGGWNPAAWCPYWEAWQINAGKKVTTYAEHADLDDDKYSQGTLRVNTKGSLAIKGSAEFYEGLALPDTFKVSNTAPAWILPSTTQAPTLAGGTGAIAHNLTATWDCCSGSDAATKLA